MGGGGVRLKTRVSPCDSCIVWVKASLKFFIHIPKAKLASNFKSFILNQLMNDY